MRRPLLCRIRIHRWQNFWNQENQRYQVCRRCADERDPIVITNYSRPDASGGMTPV